MKRKTESGANTIAFTHDTDFLVTGAGAETLNYDVSNGLLTDTLLGNVTDSYGYNTFGEMSSYSANDSTPTVFTQSYVRDKLGRIT